MWYEIDDDCGMVNLRYASHIYIDKSTILGEEGQYVIKCEIPQGILILEDGLAKNEAKVIFKHIFRQLHDNLE